MEKEEKYFALQLKTIGKSHKKWQKSWLARRKKIFDKYLEIHFW